MEQKNQELQNIIDGIMENAPAPTRDQKLKMLKNNEASISLKTVNYYLKDKEMSEKVYNQLKKILPEIILDPQSKKPLKIRTKNTFNSYNFTKQPVENLLPAKFIVNIRAKNKQSVKQLMEDITDLWHATDCNLELYELFGFTEEEYKFWLSYS